MTMTMTMTPSARGGGRALRSYTQDSAVTAHRLAPGTLRRITGFARPYRRELAVLLSLVLAEAGASC
jgi:ATP-binding cassette subfamily B protein